VRNAVGLMDLSSFAQFEVTGPGALAALQWICSADVDIAPGRLVYTQWLNDHAGIEADLTVMRLAPSQFLVVSGAGSAGRNFTWLRRSLQAWPDVQLEDVSACYCLLSLQGPLARAVMQAVTDSPVGSNDFVFGDVRTVSICGASVLAARVSYVGELGYELYCPTERTSEIFKALQEAGAPHGLRLYGTHTMNSCRIEKAFREWGHDITDQETPHDAGLMFACKLKGATDFRGRAALDRAKASGPPKTRLVQVLLQDPEPLLFHNEPLYRDGILVGLVTSAGYGHSLGAAAGLAAVHHSDGVDATYIESGAYAIEVAGAQVPAKVSLRPFYDPSGSRMRA